ncbi:MAG: 50S ribosomal protein L28 [Nitrospirota bacterium]|nr:50S ribosomal protein L28 [Nitrospirota bacterium]
MAICYVCGKIRSVGNNVSHSNRRTKRVFKPNLQRIKIVTEHGPKKTYVCTRCIRSGKITKAI